MPVVPQNPFRFLSITFLSFVYQKRVECLDVLNKVQGGDLTPDEAMDLLVGSSYDASHPEIAFVLDRISMNDPVVEGILEALQEHDFPVERARMELCALMKTSLQT